MCSTISSCTHKNTYTAVVAKDFIRKGERVLIVDDFLAIGNAIAGLRGLLGQAGAILAGCGIAIEKSFQGGGDALRAEGIHVESLAMVDSMTDTDITFRH